jgi:hypothetical protein
MIEEIEIINSSLNDLVSTFGVIFNRNTAVVDTASDQYSNAYKFVHLLVDVYI